MTIFVDLAKAFFIPQFKDYSKQSIVSDHSWWNITCTFFGGGRNVNVSEEKRSIANSVIKRLENIELQKDDDDNCKAIKEIIKNAQNEATKARNSEDLPDDGTFGQLCNELVKFLEFIKTLCINHNILNTKIDPNEPLTFAQYEEAFYNVFSEWRSSQLNWYEKILKNPNITDVVKLEKAKKQLFHNCIEETRQIYPSISGENIVFCKSKLVSAKLDAIKTRNEELCIEKAWGSSIPIQFCTILQIRFFLPVFTPSEGVFGACIKRGITNISQQCLEQVERPVCSFNS